MSRARDLADLGDGIAVADLPSDVVTTASPSLGRRNLIINGAMQVAQRGTTSTSGGYRTVDRFQSEASGGTIEQSHQNLTSGTPFDLGFRKFYRLKNTGNSTATNSYRQMIYFIESQDVANSGWNYLSTSSAMTISFWARSSLAGTYYFSMLESNGGANSKHAHAFTLAADTWTKVEYTFYGNSNLTFDNDNAAGLQLYWRVDLGADYTGGTAVLDSWTGASDITPDFTQDFSNTTNATFDITGVQLEVGSVATPFEHRSFGEELALCHRYFYSTFAQGVTPADNVSQGIVLVGAAYNAYNMTCAAYPYPVQMRTNPSLTTYARNAGSGRFATYINNTWTAGVASASATGNTTSANFYVAPSGGGLSAQNAYEANGNFTADAEL